jgi:hypothetical protein
MTALLGDMKYNSLEMQKHEKSEKVTGVLNSNLNGSGVKLARASVNEHRRGPSTPRHKAPCLR